MLQIYRTGLAICLLASGTGGLAVAAEPAAPPVAAAAAPSVRIGFANPVLMVRDLDRSVRFYTEVMGYTVVARSDITAPVSQRTVGSTRNQRTRSVYLDSGKLVTREIPASHIALVHIDDASLPQMNRGTNPDDAVQGEVMLSLVVEGLDELLRRLERGGYRILNAAQPSASGKSRIASALDPDGIRLELYEYLR